MNFKTAAALSLGSALLAGATLGSTVTDDGCKHTADRTATALAADLRRVVIEAGAGELTVRGGSSGEVKAAGRVCAASADLLAASKLAIRREGDTVYLRTVLPEVREHLLDLGSYVSMDVTVDLPRTVTLEVADSSGDLRVSDVRGARIVDSSGAQTLEHIQGDLDVTDASGSITIVDLLGSLRLADASGDVDVDGVRGDVLVRVDSSGGLDIRHVTGEVHVQNDSSGNIEIADVERDVVIDKDSSGSIRVQAVGGNFRVGSDGSGGIHYDRVAGKVSLPD